MRAPFFFQYLVPITYLIPALVAFWIGWTVRTFHMAKTERINYIRVIFFLCITEGVHNTYFFVATLMRFFHERAYDSMMLPLPWILAQGIVAAVFLLIAAYFTRERQGEIRDLGLIKELATRYKEMAYVDPLTGLYNRRMLEQALDQERKRLNATARPFSVMMIDLDHFKRYNDAHGHQMGDEVLIAASASIRANIRSEIDLAFRYGGDEFLIIFPGTMLAEAKRIGERLNESVKTVSAGEIALSAGLLEIGSPSTMRPQEIIRLVDTLMYVAKREGGNRIFTLADERKLSAPVSSAV